MPVPKTVNRLRAILRSIRRDPCEIGYSRRINGLTRFMKNRIHQNTVSEERLVWIRVIVDGRAGVALTNRFDQDSLASAAKQAEKIARNMPQSNVPVTLPSEIPLADTLSFDEFTARAQPYDRAETLRRLFCRAQGQSAELSGALSTSENTLCIVNTEGVESYQTWTRAELNLVATKGALSGRSYWVSNALSEIPFDDQLEEALKLVTCSELLGTADLPCETTVVLDHLAVGQLVGFLGWMAFGAKQYLEGQSPLCNRLGKRICSSKVTIWDDGQDPEGMPRVFDYEGVARKRVILVEKGIAKGLVTDSRTASQLQLPNTGHAAPPTSDEGPQAENLFMAGGRSTLERLIRSTENGIYVRNFHYVNVVDPITTTITGMTRDGTFRIADGRLVEPLPNLRFTVEALDVLNRITALTAETRRVEGVTGIAVVPAIKVQRFGFTSASEA
ncbi:MAG: TldD/PmbA family protein [Candidatus Sumerlaea chitinivorans]|nr:TldD/PmbA family protein [Candidatus Sumerlaea chitinivorans]